MGSVELDRKEWEAFLEKLSELERKYMLVLRELDQAHARLNSLEKPSHQEIQTAEEKIVKMEEPPTKASKQRAGILTKLKTGLSSALDALQPHAACRRCSHKLTHASRFCEKCGSDFGRPICVCGRDLSMSDTFCDHCGRRLLESSPTR